MEEFRLGFGYTSSKWVGLLTVWNGKQFYEFWLQAKNKNRMKITTSNDRSCFKVPQTATGGQQIESGGLKLWSAWIYRLPRMFSDAAEWIASTEIPLLKSRQLFPMLLFGNLVRMTIVILWWLLRWPISSLWLKRLDLLRYPRKVSQVVAAVMDIPRMLNQNLPVEVKSLFHGGMVKLFILCKFSQKQGNFPIRWLKWIV